MSYQGVKCRLRMTDREKKAGWVLFALVVLVFPYLMGVIQRLIGGIIPIAQANVVYYILICAALVVIFRFWLQGHFALFFDRLPENMFAVVSGLVILGVLQWLAVKIPLPVDNPYYPDMLWQYRVAPGATVLILMVFIPLVEEVFFRGLLFGTLKRRSRALAWVVTVSVYCIYCVWQYVFNLGHGPDLRYFLLVVQYLPVALATVWCCDRGGSVWASFLLHMLGHGMGLFLLVSGAFVP